MCKKACFSRYYSKSVRYKKLGAGVKNCSKSWRKQFCSAMNRYSSWTIFFVDGLSGHTNTNGQVNVFSDITKGFLVMDKKERKLKDE